jgi:two-component system, chemotaxis family, sensor kinase Cph1
MHQVSEFFSKLFSPDSWPARWHCGNWSGFHGWLYIISSLLIAAAYFSIPVLLFLLIRKTKNKLPFLGIFWLFILFILACGLTHVMDATMFWFPVYRVSAIVLLATAIVSWAAVIALYKVLPKALTLKSPAELERIIAHRTVQLTDTNEELQTRNSELKKAKQETELLLRQKDEFMNIASHELKTPVTALKIYAHLLAEEAEKISSENKEMHQKMNSQIDKMTILINEMLDSSRLQEGRLQFTKIPFKLNLLVERVVSSLQRTTSEHKLVIETNEEIEIVADKERIKQVFEHIILNAIKYSHENGKVLINVKKENDHVLCSVQDFGHGIPEEEQDRIFDRFYKVIGNNMNTFPGMGLGLFLSKYMVEGHHGKIWVESDLGKGSTFYFTLSLDKQ